MVYGSIPSARSKLFTRPMKIVHLCLASFFIDNYSYQENLLPKYHVKMGYDVTVIASLASFGKDGKSCFLDGESERQDANGYKVIRIGYKEPTKVNVILRYYNHFAKTLSEEAPDVIFIHGLQFSDLDVVIRYKKRHPEVKLYADNHADYVNSAHGFVSTNILHKIIWRYHIKKAEPYIEKCFGVTPLRCDFLRDMYNLPTEKIDFLPMGVDDEAIPSDRLEVRNRVRKDLGVADDDFLLFTGGKIDSKKNTHFLLRAIEQLNVKKCHLVICGVITPEMESIIKPMLTENIHDLGWCNAERVMECMTASDAACFPGTHSTLWEQAVGVGLPIVVKRWDGMEHVNVDGNCIFLKGEDESEIVDALSQLLVDNQFETFKTKAAAASKQFLYSEISKKAIGLI